MKIKYWLMGVFLAAMLLPIIALYLLYISLNSYHENLFMKEHFELENQIATIEPHLQDPYLYQLHTPEYYESLKKLTNASQKISLYRPDGLVLYESMKPTTTNASFVDRQKLYQHVNELQKKSRSYTIKKTLFHNGELIGLYEITIGRDHWVEGVKYRTFILTASLALFIVILYTVILLLVNRKLNKPLKKLSIQMTAFADGKDIKNTLYANKDEIGELITHFNQMREKINDSNRLLNKQQQEKEFIVASLSHDLKTPLTTIQTYTEALQNNQALTETEKEEYRQILFDKMAYMKQILDDLSVYTSLQSAKTTLNLVEVDGEEFFDMLLSGYEEQCTRKRITLLTEQQIHSSYRVDPKQMMRIMDNLMANAIRHTNEHRQIGLAAIETHCPLPDWVFHPIAPKLDAWRKDRTILIIQNEGLAIPYSLQNKIFEPFVQGDDARAKGSSGLGLSIVKMLIEQHGGSIALWSEPGYGTLIACSLKTNIN
ncbi:HAMP domain-containing sensor histidine kinase [Bacillus sp. REN10]|uniref:HAMP domain-containing sensor histidine kinase n=1 Tax=Bacillus sp. REN10 TaxID=2782541 RepID=UPI00193BAD5E|nr:HAMP domain-containing sensor histidine kinase [Bacillus sp. REN10]